MRVFCHEHKRGFLAPRQSPIKCENRGHILGEMDFSGDAKQVFQTQWQYCCNCEHFCVVNFESEALQRCPVCTRKTTMVYLCERCYTISFESNTPLQTKNFTLTAEGAPRPCCPACLQPASTDLREHTCEHAGTSFVTGLNVCPLCEERLDVGPTFPSSVADYLRKTKVANKVYVTFDYETGLFVHVEDGEFVAINNHDEDNKTFLLPRSPRLASLREFYELYQDYYLCATPETGEINISEPAALVGMAGGWRLLKTGSFQITGGQRRANVATPPVQPPKHEEPKSARPAPDESAIPCTSCGTPVEDKYGFCWKCGHPRAVSEELSNARPERSRLIVSATEPDGEERATQHEPRANMKSSLSSLITGAKNRSSRSSGSVLRLLGVGIAGILGLTLTLFTLTRSRTSDATAAQPNATASQPATTTSVPNVEIKPASLQAPVPKAEDNALARLREMGNSTDTSKVLRSLSVSEKQFSDDYRFPYERARIVVKSNWKNLEVEAFAALARAAQKAINKGKASEMLQSLKADGGGDFQKLSRGHREWAQLQKALRSKDVTVLEEGQGL